MILRALQDAPRLGIGSDELAASIGRTRNCVKTTVYRLISEGRAAVFARSHFSRYFASQEARDAAADELAEVCRVIREQKAAVSKEARLKRDRERWHANPRRHTKKLAGSCGVPAAELLLDALVAAAPNGRSINALAQETGRHYETCKASLHRLREAGRAHSANKHAYSEYFARAEDAAAAQRLLDAPKPVKPKPVKLERVKPYDIQRREHDEQPKPKKAQPVIDWSQAKRTECRPTMAGRQYEVSGHVAGGFYSEWMALRGQA